MRSVRSFLDTSLTKRSSAAYWRVWRTVRSAWTTSFWGTTPILLRMTA